MPTPRHNPPPTPPRWENFRLSKEALGGLRRVLEADGATLPDSDDAFELIAHELLYAVAEVYGDELLRGDDERA